MVWVDTRTAAPTTPTPLFYRSDIEGFIVLRAVCPYVMATQTKPSDLTADELYDMLTENPQAEYTPEDLDEARE